MNMYKILLEKSLTLKSTLTPFLNENIKERIQALNESNGTENIDGYQALITDVITRLKQVNDIEHFCSVIPIKTPEGKLPVLTNKLTGLKSLSATATDNLIIVNIDDETTFTVDGDVSSSGTGVGKVLYKEPGKLLIKVTSGVFAITETIDNVSTYVGVKATLAGVYTATHALGTMLSEYSGNYATSVGEALDDYRQIEFQVALSDILVTSKYINTGLSKEFISDMFRIYGIDYYDTLVDAMVQVIKDMERQKIFSFMRANAYQRNNMVLTNSYGVNGGIDRVYADLYARANQSKGAIGTNTKIAGNYVVIGSSNVVAGLETYLGKRVTVQDGIRYLPNGIALIEDSYAVQDYIMTALSGPMNNGAIVYTPYMLHAVTAKDSTDFSENIKVQIRSDIVNNPLATKVNDQSKNEMLELTYVDMTSLTNMF